MRVDWLELTNFRSYPEVRFEPDPGINLLNGPNGAGKTSVLEAIAYLSLLRSLRGVPDGALIREGEDGAIIRGAFAHSSGELTVEVELPAQGRRRVLVNAKRPVRYRDVAAQVPIVGFLPDDLDLIKRGPAHRRDYLDDLAAQLSPAAAADQAEYAKTLQQRNALLRSEEAPIDLGSLRTWDERLASSGARVIGQRLDLISDLRAHLDEAEHHLDESSRLAIEYTSPWWQPASPAGSESEIRESLDSALVERRDRDIAQRTTTAGPHRDDPVVTLDGRAARTEASQGEQRSAALALRLGAYRLLEERHPHQPILLLDDVLSELDERRARVVLELLPLGQVLVTSAREDDQAIDGRRWRVGDGKVV